MKLRQQLLPVISICFSANVTLAVDDSGYLAVTNAGYVDVTTTIEVRLMLISSRQRFTGTS